MFFQRAQQQVRYWESKYVEAEELVRALGKGLDQIPITAIGKGMTWMPSNEAISTIKKSKDRLTEWREEQNGGKQPFRL